MVSWVVRIAERETKSSLELSDRASLHPNLNSWNSLLRSSFAIGARALPPLCSAFLTVFICLGLAGIGSARAGGGPENVLLVVNANSQSSLTIANYYIDLRKIPASNVVYLDWRGSFETTSLDTFRDSILKPVLEQIEKRKLRGQIDYLIYSSDFPTRIDIKSAMTGKQTSKALAPTASLTGLTYLYQLVLANPSLIAGMNNNFYASRPSGRANEKRKSRSLAFRHWYGWAQNAKRMESGGPSYYLSTMLGVTSGRGNKLAEVISYLRRSAATDNTHPRGTIYYVQNDNVRSKTRQGGFDDAVAELKELNVRAEVVFGKLPQGKRDVQGAMIGTEKFSWRQSGSIILPGAICEHLTSYGGILKKRGAQTPLTEFLKYGAAGASGTVVEPLALQAKFPLPSIHVHYARGCSLAESFYQSVSGPFQLLIVGDPLCQPWADLPKLKVSGINSRTKIDKPISFSPQARMKPGKKIEHFELYVGGVLRSRCRAGEQFTLDGAELIDGVREVRVVAIGDSPIESQGRLILPIQIKNKGGSASLRVTNRSSIAADGEIRLTARCSGATKIAIYQNRRRLGEIQGERGRLIVPINQIGAGPITLYAIGMAPHPVYSQRVRIETTKTSAQF